MRPARGCAQNSLAASTVVPYSAKGMTALASFTFVRHIDGLRYERDGEHNLYDLRHLDPEI